jgi:outer membrane protein assembly factor BamB
MARLGLERGWMALVPIAGTERLLSISLADGMIFAQTSMANFYAYDAESGRLLWMAHLGSQSATARPASVNSRLVFVTNATQLFALDRQTGLVVWAQDLNTLPSSPTACDEQRVMVGLTSGKLVAFDLYAPSDETKTLYRTPRTAWNWQTSGGALSSRPLPAQQFVAFGGRDGRLYVALADLPTEGPAVLLYRVATGGEIVAPLGSYGTRTILVPSADKNVYAVDLFAAEVKWAYPSGAPVMQEPMAAGDDIYTVNTAGLLSSLDARTGERRWMTSTQGGRLMSVSVRRLYLESRDRDLFIVDRGTGQVIADPRVTLQRAGLNLREYSVGLTNNQNDRIYTATPSGLLMCLREIGQLQPRPLRDPKQPPLGYIPPEGGLTPGTQPATPTPAPTTEPPPAENNAPAPEAGVPAPAGGFGFPDNP